MTKAELLKRAKEISDLIEAKQHEIAQCEIDIAHLQKEEREMLKEYRIENRKECYDVSPLLDLERTLYITAGGGFYQVLFSDKPINYHNLFGFVSFIFSLSNYVDISGMYTLGVHPTSVFGLGWYIIRLALQTSNSTVKVRNNTL